MAGLTFFTAKGSTGHDARTRVREDQREADELEARNRYIQTDGNPSATRLSRRAATPQAMAARKIRL